MATLLQRAALAAATVSLAVSQPQAQTPDHVAAVKAAQEKSPARAGSCAAVGEDFLGWPADVVQRCDYKVGETQGVVYLLDVKPETLALWIETSCEKLMSGVAACFDRILRCSAERYGASFPIAGNLIAETGGAAQNMFYRNGVAIGAGQNGAAAAVPAEEQEKLARTPEAAGTTMLSGGAVAMWHTMPHQFAVKAIDLGVPAEMNTPDRRQKWLEIVRAEMLAALKQKENRFLAGWMTAHPIVLRAGECPDDRDP